MIAYTLPNYSFLCRFKLSPTIYKINQVKPYFKATIAKSLISSNPHT